MVRIVLFGATGLMGTELVRAACRIKEVELAALTRGEADLMDPVAVREAILARRPDAVINVAGFIDMWGCERDPALAFALNTRAAVVMAEAAQEAGAILVQTGTHLVFDGTREEPYRESDPVRPCSYYAASKHMAEVLGAARCPRSYVVRFPTLYGHRRNQVKGFVEKMLERLRGGQSPRVAEDRMDSVTYAADAASAVLGLVLGARPFGLYHIANAGAQSYFDFTEELARLSGAGVPVIRARDAEFVQAFPKPLRLAIESEKLPPLRPWREALSEYCESLAEDKVP